jgi:probable rRNA maturation factor
MPASASELVLFRRAPHALARGEVRRFAALLRREVAGGRLFRCLLADDRELQRLNRMFLGRDYPTDVLTFPEPGPDGFLGEIAISCERAAEQARRYGHSPAQEAAILMLHGVLHLLGMDHERDRGRMARVERKWRKALGLPSGLIERAGS